MTTIVILALLALMGFANAPSPEYPHLDPAALAILEKIEDNVRPILPLRILKALTFGAIISWF